MNNLRSLRSNAFEECSKDRCIPKHVKEKYLDVKPLCYFFAQCGKQFIEADVLRECDTEKPNTFLSVFYSIIYVALNIFTGIIDIRQPTGCRCPNKLISC